MKIAIAGYGISGKAVEKLAACLGFETVIYDEKQQLGRYHADGSPDYDSADEIVISPGVPPSSRLHIAASASGIRLTGEMEFGFRHCGFPLLAVTGTNGKTTTTELAAHLLRHLGYKARVCGNIGTPLSELAWLVRQKNTEKPEVAVIEVSSFQLEKTENFAPLAAAVLNVAADHLDRYQGSTASYAAVKFSIFDRITNPRDMILGMTMRETPELVPEKYRFLLQNDEPAIRIDGDDVILHGKPLLKLSETGLRGRHNHENLLAALSLIEAFAGTEKLMTPELKKAAKEFSPGEHRIRIIREHGKITYIDDSKGTNPAAVLAGLEAVGGDHNVCLLLGGMDKGMDFSVLSKAEPRLKGAWLFGQSREKIYDALHDAFPCEICSSFGEAVKKAAAAAQSGDAVMLSPACASMDMFRDYKERGETFARLVDAIIREGNPSR